MSHAVYEEPELGQQKDVELEVSPTGNHDNQIPRQNSNGVSEKQGGLRKLQALWNRSVKLPFTRFVEGVVMRRQIERFYLIFGGHIFFQTLRSAVQLDLFSLLAKHGRLTRAQIAEHLGIEQQPARILLLGCTSVGLLKKRGNTYSNSSL
ncbi:MAG: methyltransferase dimerization domain-containing protein, partial [Thermoguttaceae bacterium]